MNAEEKLICTASSLYQRRRDYKQLVGPEKYNTETKIAREFIKAIKNNANLSTLSAVIYIIKASDPSPLEAAAIFSAAVDMIEGAP